MEHRQADVRPVAGRGASGDDAARFLHELRQLRNGAGLGHAELAARAHYPYDCIKAAEVGPSLPDLPVLSAFVKGCGGTTEEWEERWRSLTRSPSLPVSATRQSGRSDAADAGARIGSTAQTGDGPDPSVILAALDRVAEEMSSPGGEAAVAPPVTPDLAPPSVFSSFSPDEPSLPDQPAAASKPAGWDPIRVSSAWPALAHTPTVAEAAGVAGPSSGAGAPWDAAPWANDTAGPAGQGTDGDLSAAGRSAGTAAASEATASAARQGRSSRTTLIVAAVILLCVIAALLALLL